MASFSALIKSISKLFRPHPVSARILPFVTSTVDRVYLWSGQGDTESKTVFIYSHEIESWTKQPTEGPHPPTGLCDGGCTLSEQCLYLYGGYGESSCHDDLNELNTKTWKWRKVHGGSAGGPVKKAGCRMISYQDNLLVIGGCYDGTPSSEQAGASYKEERTNVVHFYNLTTG